MASNIIADNSRIEATPGGYRTIYTGKMVPDGLGGLVEQIIVETPGHQHHLTKPAPAVCTIYFIGPEDGPIKIGFARRLAFRLRELELANAYPLRVWASVDGPPKLEREYHKRFAAHRLHGEWFERAPEILAEIERLASPASHRMEVRCG